jgi:hypothetical protein
MGVGELLDSTFSLYRRNFVLIAAISALVQVPYALLTYVIYQVFNYPALQSSLSGLSARLRSGELTPDQFQSQVFSALGGIFLSLGILVLVGLFVVLPLAEAATTRAVSDRYLDRETSVGVSYAAALRRLGALVLQSLILVGGVLLLAALVVGLIVGLSLAGGPAGAGLGILLLVPFAGFVIFVFVRTSLAPPAIVLEGLSGPRGLARSWNLVRGFFWRMFGIRLLLFLITAIIEGVVGVLITLPGFGLDANGRFLLQEVASAIAAVFVGPVTYIGVTLLYYDARIRKEGFDIEMLAKSL